ncbi:diguanylate cyclase domain-containing protein [Rheinheimera marina]|uniref:Diguanylate cyclase domain-containing protein n=1 Tax=Rheinheimera marina TaxID=1774958 RepID=A0ABV9JGG2_9GAMM
MSFEIVHSVGCALYLVFFVLMLFARKVPRTNPGCGWWALAILAACCARLFNVGLFPIDAQLAKLAYSLLSLSEKLLLLLGATAFFGAVVQRAAYIGLAAACALCLVAAQLLHWSVWVPNLALGLVNCLLLLALAYTVLKGESAVPALIRRSIALFACLRAVHWFMLEPVSLVLFDGWRTQAFWLGTVLVVGLYLSLISAVFALFQQRLMASETRALEMAYKDPLTGLNNKRYVDALFEQVLLLANRPHQLLAVFYIDLDNFKPINDQAGHKAGDAVLKEVARRLRQYMRSTDVCARVGGDEFLVIATQLEHPHGVSLVAEKLSELLELPVQIDGQSYSLGASIGISIYPQHGRQIAELIEKADEAMYSVKRSGRHGFTLYAMKAEQVSNQLEPAADD